MPELTSSDLQAFRAFEQAGWDKAATMYDPLAGMITKQAVERLLDATHVGRGTRLLDIACGPGDASGRAIERGATALGIDIAPSMVVEARKKFSQAEFQEGDAEALPCDDTSFDAVVCNFGLLHVADPDKAIAEAYRVLQSGGHYAFTVWGDPATGASYLSMLFGAIQSHADMSVPLPPTPPLFRFCDHEECNKALSAVGFVDPAVVEFTLIWHAASIEMLLEFVQHCTARARMLIEQQTAEVRARIYKAIEEGAKQFEREGRLEVPWPAVLATARKP